MNDVIQSGRFLPDPIAINQLREVTANLLASRGGDWRNIMDPRKNLEQECGYPEGYVPPEFFYNLYRKDCLARRAVQVWADEGWSVAPDVYEEARNKVTTDWERSWAELPSSITGPVKNYFNDPESNPLWEWLQRFDDLSGIGTYGILLYGLNDGRPLSEPVAGFQENGSISSGPVKRESDGNYKRLEPSVNKEVITPYSLTRNAARTSGRKLLYLKVFPEALAQIEAFEVNPTSPRYGLPVSYSINLNESITSENATLAPTSTVSVHWTRVQHLAVQMESSETFATPILEPLLPRILDCRKIYGASGEGYYRLGFPGISLESHPTLGGDVDLSISATRDQLEQYMNGMQKYLINLGMTAKTLPPSVTDPTTFLDKHIQAICMALDVPHRVFMGSERGELSSEQDDRRHKGKSRKRRNRYQSPRMLNVFVNNCIAFGVLATPKKGLKACWPDPDTQTEGEKADRAVKLTQALVSYRASKAEVIMSPVDYYNEVWGMTVEEAEAIIKDADQYIKTTGGLEPVDPPELGGLKGETGIKTKTRKPNSK